MKKAALIGLGMVTETHLKALRDSRNLSLAGVLGRDTAKTRSYAEGAGALIGANVKAYSSLSELCADTDVDFAILATPPDARTEYVEALSSAGKPILIEKPIERTLDAATHIVDVCDAADVPLGIVFQHRARDASLALKARVDQGDLGQIVSAEVRVPWWRDQAYYDAPGRGTKSRDGGGVMMTQAIHALDLALWLLGPVKRIQALMHKTILHRMETEDWAGAFFETEAGCMGNLFATTAAFPGGSESIALHGTKASANLEAGVMTLRHHDGRVETAGETAATGGGADPMAFSHGWHQTVLEDFAAKIDTGAPPLASGREALKSHAVIDAMERSSAQGVWVEVDAS